MGRLGGISLLGLGHLGGVLCRLGRIELDLRVGLGGFELRRELRGLGSRLLLQILCPRLSLVRPSGGKHLLRRTRERRQRWS